MNLFGVRNEKYVGTINIQFCMEALIGCHVQYYGRRQNSIDSIPYDNCLACHVLDNTETARDYQINIVYSVVFGIKLVLIQPCIIITHDAMWFTTLGVH